MLAQGPEVVLGPQKHTWGSDSYLGFGFTTGTRILTWDSGDTGAFPVTASTTGEETLTWGSILPPFLGLRLLCISHLG